jgi:hypothetical protein
MELINKGTKPCPSCGCMIYKISGCDQMFCMECHTAFSWNRGTIEKGVVHNPHYYEFVRSNKNYVPRNNGDHICGGLPRIYNLLDDLNNSYVKDYNIQALSDFHRTVSHILNVEMRNIINQDNTQLRISYLNNLISEKEFKLLIQQKEKKIQKKTRIHEINQMFVDISIETFIKITSFEKKNIRDFNIFIEEQLNIIDKLVIYYNENIKKICKYFKCVYPGISENFDYHNNYEIYLKRKNKN